MEWILAKCFWLPYCSSYAYRLAILPVSGSSLSSYPSLPPVYWRWGGAALELMNGGGTNSFGSLVVCRPISLLFSKACSKSLLASTLISPSHPRHRMKGVILLNYTCSNGQPSWYLQLHCSLSTWSGLLLGSLMLSTADTNHGALFSESSSLPSGWSSICIPSSRVWWGVRTGHQPLWLYGQSFLPQSSPYYGFVSIHSPPVWPAQMSNNVELTARGPFKGRSATERKCDDVLVNWAGLLNCRMLVVVIRCKVCVDTTFQIPFSHLSHTFLFFCGASGIWGCCFRQKDAWKGAGGVSLLPRGMNKKLKLMSFLSVVLFFFTGPLWSLVITNNTWTWNGLTNLRNDHCNILGCNLDSPNLLLLFFSQLHES